MSNIPNKILYTITAFIATIALNSSAYAETSFYRDPSNQMLEKQTVFFPGNTNAIFDDIAEKRLHEDEDWISENDVSELFGYKEKKEITEKLEADKKTETLLKKIEAMLLLLFKKHDEKMEKIKKELERASEIKKTKKGKSRKNNKQIGHKKDKGTDKLFPSEEREKNVDTSKMMISLGKTKNTKKGSGKSGERNKKNSHKIKLKIEINKNETKKLKKYLEMLKRFANDKTMVSKLHLRVTDPCMEAKQDFKNLILQISILLEKNCLLNLSFKDLFLSEEDSRVLVKAFTKNSSLLTLDLRNALMNKKTARLFVKSLGEHPSLQILGIPLDEKFFIALNKSNALEKNNSLKQIITREKELSFYFNSVANKNCLAIKYEPSKRREKNETPTQLLFKNVFGRMAEITSINYLITQILLKTLNNQGVIVYRPEKNELFEQIKISIFANLNTLKNKELNFWELSDKNIRKFILITIMENLYALINDYEPSPERHFRLKKLDELITLSRQAEHHKP